MTFLGTVYWFRLKQRVDACLWIAAAAGLGPVCHGTALPHEVRIAAAVLGMTCALLGFWRFRRRFS